MKPTVSAIIPTYNRADLLGRALDSVIAQDYRPLEAVVIDDGSTDHTPRVIEAYRHTLREQGVNFIFHRQQNGRAPKARRPRRWGRRIGVALLVLVVLLVGLGVWVDSRLNRVDALTDYAGRPAATPGADWLIVGSDSRQGLDESRRRELGTGQAAGRRADTMMLLHIPRGTGKPVLISLPRDSYVPIPGHGRNKLNAAYAFGGPQLLSRTVEQVSGIRLDRYMEVGFDGFASVVDAVGGVQICPDKAMRDPMAGLNVKAGCQVVASKQALAYVAALAATRIPVPVADSHANAYTAASGAGAGTTGGTRSTWL